MKHLIFLFFVLISIASCSGQQSTKDSHLITADNFLKALSNNNANEILNYTYSKVDDKIRDKELREFYVNKAYTFIHRFGIPEKSKWIIKEDLQNEFDRLVITIPLFKGYDSTLNLLEADLVIAFPPSQVSDKIYRFDIVDNYDLDQITPIRTPKATDTTSHH